MAVDEQALAVSIENLTSTFRNSAAPPVQMASAHLAAVVAAADDLLSTDAVGILLLDDTDKLRAVASTSALADRLEEAQQSLGIGPGHDCMDRRETVLVEDLAAEPDYAPLVAELASLQVGGVLSAPIWVGGAVIGNLNLTRHDAHRWTEPEVRAATAYAEVVGQLLGASAQSGRVRPFPDRTRTTDTGGGSHAG